MPSKDDEWKKKKKTQSKLQSVGCLDWLLGTIDWKWRLFREQWRACLSLSSLWRETGTFSCLDCTNTRPCTHMHRLPGKWLFLPLGSPLPSQLAALNQCRSSRGKKKKGCELSASFCSLGHSPLVWVVSDGQARKKGGENPLFTLNSSRSRGLRAAWIEDGSGVKEVRKARIRGPTIPTDTTLYLSHSILTTASLE